MSTPVMLLNSSAATCIEPPAPELEKLSLPGWLFASAISSFTEFAGTEGCTRSSRGRSATIETGAKSLTGS